jgi:hypothetical protein
VLLAVGVWPSNPPPQNRVTLLVTWSLKLVSRWSLSPLLPDEEDDVVGPAIIGHNFRSSESI